MFIVCDVCVEHSPFLCATTLLWFLYEGEIFRNHQCALGKTKKTHFCEKKKLYKMFINNFENVTHEFMSI
jgi:hypothetical protein